jgi:hypothetical protein
MMINGTEIPTFMVNMIRDHMTTLIGGGMKADIDTLHYAVSMANADVQAIGTQMLAGNAHHNASEIRNAIAAEVHAELTA